MAQLCNCPPVLLLYLASLLLHGLYQPSISSAANWGAFRSEGCSRPGYQKYDSKLWNIDGDWDATCRSMPATVRDTNFAQPDNCVSNIFDGEWGEFYLLDRSCNPNWEAFMNEGCVGNGRRQFASKLLDIPYGESWEFWCANAWAQVSGMFFLQPTECVSNRFSMWGRFHVPDPCCPDGTTDTLNLPSCVAATANGGPPYAENAFPKTASAAVDAFGADDFLAGTLATYLYRSSIDQQQEFFVTEGMSGGILPYHVSICPRDEGLCFDPTSSATESVDKKSIPALSVPHILASELTDGNTIPSDRFFSLPLDNKKPTLRIIATGPVPACCFTLGWDKTNRILYMAHVQPDPNDSRFYMRTAKDLEIRLRQQEQPFGRVTLDVDKIYHISSNSERYGGYGVLEQVSANVIGLVGSSKAYIVVQFVSTTTGIIQRTLLIPIF